MQGDILTTENLEIVCIPDPEAGVVDPPMRCFTLPVDRSEMALCPETTNVPETDAQWYMELKHQAEHTGEHANCLPFCTPIQR